MLPRAGLLRGPWLSKVADRRGVPVIEAFTSSMGGMGFALPSCQSGQAHDNPSRYRLAGLVVKAFA